MDEKDKTKILITQDYNPLKGTGISVATFGVAVELAKLGNNITFASYDLPTDLDKTTKNDVKIVKLKTIDDLITAVKEANLVIPAVSFSYGFKTFGIAVTKVCELNQTPYIPWVHTTVQNSKFNEVSDVNNYVQDTAMFLMGNMFKSAMCKSIVAVSTAVKESIMAFDIPETKVKVILNGLDIKAINAKLSENVTKTNDIICVQRLSREKGNQVTVLVLANLKKLVPNFKAIIVGDGEEVGMVKSLIKVFDLQNNVTLMPKVVNGELVKLIDESKVFLSTSFTESFGLAVAESMLVGTPVVVPDIEGPKELTENGKFGFTYDPADTLSPAKIIATILEGKTKLAEMVKNAKLKIATECDVVNQAKKFERLIIESI